MSQLKELQRLLFIDACSEEAKGKRFLASRAWKELQELKLRLQMKAPPRPIDTLELERRRERAKARSSGPSEEGWRKRKREPKVVALPDPGAPATQVASEQTSPTKAN